MWAASLAAFTNPRIRLLEDEIPDALPGEAEEQARDTLHDEKGLGATAPITGN